MPTLVEIGPSNTSQGQHRRKDATEQMKNLTLARTRTQVLGLSSADALPTKQRVPAGRTCILILISCQILNSLRCLPFIWTFILDMLLLRANIASEHVTSTLVTGTIVAAFSTFEKVSQLTVKECILTSAPKSCELDPIPSKLLTECLDSSLPSLTDLFNSSLASGIFPQCFKSALVTPILKKKCLDHNDLNNYRPVSNLCFIAKILEKLVLSQVSSYLNSHNLHNTCQSAYRSGHSTETALLKVVNDLFLSLNKGNISVLALLDFSSAFDTIDHTRNKGRPKFRWRDDLDKFRKHWHRDASDRLRWRQLGKAYVQLRTFKG